MINLNIGEKSHKIGADHPDLTIAVNWEVKQQQTNKSRRVDVCHYGAQEHIVNVGKSLLVYTTCFYGELTKIVFRLSPSQVCILSICLTEALKPFE